MSISFGEWDITKVSEGSGGGGGGVDESKVKAIMNYPTGDSALSDTTLYDYIKGLYDTAYSIIDTNKYWTVEGSPTITDMGIASGFSSSNYCKLSALDLSNASSWELEIEATTPSSISGSDNKEVLAFSNSWYGIRIGYWSNNGAPNIFIETSFTGSSEVDYEVPVSTKFKVKIEFTGTEYKYSIAIADSSYTLIQTITSSNKITTLMTNCLLGNCYDDLDHRAWDSTINLASFRFKVDNELIYFGYAIPCKVLSSGSKVVDVANKALVDKYAEGYGSAPYYVIDTANQTVTEPKGDIFGFITQKQSASNTIIQYVSPVATAVLGYPTGITALSDSTLYNYIKTMYDSGVTVTRTLTNLVMTGTYTISNNGVLTEADTDAKIYMELEGNVVPTAFNIKGSFTATENQGENFLLDLRLDKDADGDASSVLLERWNTNENPYTFVLYYRRGENDRTYKIGTDNVWSVNTKCYFEINYDGTDLTLSVGSSFDNLTEIITIDDFAPVAFKYLFIGTYNSTFATTNYSIQDLNDYEAIIEGQGYYTPYYYIVTSKQVKSGSYIVDVSNKSQIDLIASHTGSTPYYIIDITNQTVIQPRGDIFGFITQALG